MSKSGTPTDPGADNHCYLPLRATTNRYPMNQADLMQSLHDHMERIGYAHSPIPAPATGKTYQVRVPDGARNTLHIAGRIPYKNDSDEDLSDITWTGAFSLKEGLKVLAIDAMVAPTSLLARLSSPTSLRPRITFRAGAMDPDDPEQTLEDLMPLLQAIEAIAR